MANIEVEFPRALGWVGLGAMGFPMATQLVRKMPRESKLYVYDINEEVMNKFVAEEGKNTDGSERVFIANDAREVAERADFIITIVPEGSHVRAVYLTTQTGLLAIPDTARKIFIDCSTIDINTSQKIASAIESSSYTSPPFFLDAPVSGGTAGASAATLTFMLGISPDHNHLPLFKRVLGTMGTNIHTLGGPTLGLAAKLSNNYLSGIIALATSEAMNLGMRLGIDPTVLSKCFATSSGGNTVNSTVNPVPGVCPGAVTSRGYEGGFKVQLMKKDMTLAIEAAKDVGAKLVLGSAGLGAYSAASEDPRCRDKDSRVVYRWLGGFEPDVSISQPKN